MNPHYLREDLLDRVNRIKYIMVLTTITSNHDLDHYCKEYFYHD